MKKLLVVMLALVVTFGLISVSFAEITPNPYKDPNIIKKVIKSIITQEEISVFLKGLTTVPTEEDAAEVDEFTADLNAGNVVVENAFIRLGAEELKDGIITLNFVLTPAGKVNSEDIESNLIKKIAGGVFKVSYDVSNMDSELKEKLLHYLKKYSVIDGDVALLLIEALRENGAGVSGIKYVSPQEAQDVLLDAIKEMIKESKYDRFIYTR